MDPLYLEGLDSCYIREFEAEVLVHGEADNGKYVVLDRTAFYPTGGGQPSDTGILDWSEGSCQVLSVRKKDIIMHFIDGPAPPIGCLVRGKLDWTTRYGNMRMHTAQHLVSSIIWRRFKARTVGNQIHPNRSRIDFAPLRLNKEDLAIVQDEVNRTIAEGHTLRIDFRERSFFEGLEDIERLDMDRVPITITSLRTVSIGENGTVDICPCAGTHVKALSELGKLRILDMESKGKDRIRIEYTLEGTEG